MFTPFWIIISFLIWVAVSLFCLEFDSMSEPAFVSVGNPSLSPCVLWQGAVQGQHLWYPFHYNSVPWKPFWLSRSVTERSKKAIFIFNNFCDLFCCWRSCESHVGELWAGFRMLLQKRWPLEQAGHCWPGPDPVNPMYWLQRGRGGCRTHVSILMKIFLQGNSS